LKPLEMRPRITVDLHGRDSRFEHVDAQDAERNQRIIDP
jgi:hypothetical protein